MMPPGTRWLVDIIDTWAMTITTLDGPIESGTRVDLPGRPYIAVGLTRVADSEG